MSPLSCPLDKFIESTIRLNMCDKRKEKGAPTKILWEPRPRGGGKSRSPTSAKISCRFRLTGGSRRPHERNGNERGQLYLRADALPRGRGELRPTSILSPTCGSEKESPSPHWPKGGRGSLTLFPSLPATLMGMKKGKKRCSGSFLFIRPLPRLLNRRCRDWS